MKKLLLLFILVGTLLGFNIPSEAREVSARDKNNLVGNVELNYGRQVRFVVQRRYYRPRYRRVYRYRTYRTYRYVPRYRYRTYRYRTIYIPRYRNRTYYRQVYRYRAVPRYRRLY